MAGEELGALARLPGPAAEPAFSSAQTAPRAGQGCDHQHLAAPFAMLPEPAQLKAAALWRAANQTGAMLAHHSGACVFMPHDWLTPEHPHPAQSEDALPHDFHIYDGLTTSSRGALKANQARVVAA